MITGTVVGRLVRSNEAQNNNGTVYANLVVESRKPVGDKTWKKFVSISVYGKNFGTTLEIPIGSTVAATGEVDAFHTEKNGKHYANLAIVGQAVWIKENQPE